MTNLMADAVTLLLCYLIGAIPTGLIVGLRCYNLDLRQHGSKNIGATNAMRVFGWKIGLGVFLVDVGKAAGAVYLAAAITAAPTQGFLVLAGTAVLLGNFFNIFLGGKGGKGVATSLGVFLALAPKAVVVALILFGIVLAATRYVSLGSLVAAAAMPVLVLFLYGMGWLFVMMIVIAVLVFVKHRANIRRLLEGTESKVGAKKS